MKPLPTISCQKCNILQTYTCQANCKSCGARFNNWHVASQLQHQAVEWRDEKRQILIWKNEMGGDHNNEG